MKSSTLSLAALTVTAMLALSGCAAPSSAPNDDGRVQVVTTTNVYGDIASQLGGERVTVTSIINSGAKDPHSYEASARDRLVVQGADLVIENGGGYDAFMHDLLDESNAVVVTAVERSHDFPGNEGHEADATHETEHDEKPDHDDEPGHDEGHSDEGHSNHDHGDHDHIEGFNEHVWFDPHTMNHLVADIAQALGDLDPDGKTQFTANAEALQAEIAQLEADLSALGDTHAGTGVFVTEPVPGYLAAGAGLKDLAPEGFAAAVEEGRDVPPALLLKALDAIASGDVRAVLTNAQTGGAETRRIEVAAREAGLPVVEFTEILPADTTYAEWMRSAIDSLAAALAA